MHNSAVVVLNYFSLCNFRDLVYAQSACKKAKLEIASYDPFKEIAYMT